MSISKIYVKISCDKKTNCTGESVELNMQDITHYNELHFREEAEIQGWKYEEGIGYVCLQCQE